MCWCWMAEGRSLNSMPSLPTHAIVGLALGQAAPAESQCDGKYWVLAIGCSVLPDFDVIDLASAFLTAICGASRDDSLTLVCCAARCCGRRDFGRWQGSSLPEFVPVVFSHRLSRSTRCHDKRRFGNCILFAVRYDSIFFPLAANSSFAHWDWRIFFRARREHSV